MKGEPIIAPARISGESYFPSLTGMRTVAASMVFLVHFNPFKVSFFGRFLHDFIGEFHVGVTIFFVLSGFLICYRYKETVSLKGDWFRNYFVRRFARIYPMYFIVTVFVFLPPVCHCSFRENGSLFLLNLSFLRGFFDEYKFTGAKTGWSLTVEEMFYLLFPFIILVSGKIRLLLQALIFLLSGLLLWAIFRNIPFHGFFATLQFLFEYTFFGRCVEFYTGILLALYVRRKHLLNTRKHPIGPARPNPPYRTITGLLGMVVCISLLTINSQHFKEGTAPFLFFETLLNNFLLPPGIALLFYGLISERTLLRKILETRIFTGLGKSSYVFYLIHNGPLFAFLYFTLHQQVEVIFVLTHALSFALYVCIEKPLNKLIRRKFIRPASPGNLALSS